MEIRKVKCLHCYAQFFIDKAGEHVCPPPPVRLCSICGIDEKESQWGMLVDFTVICARGEEGYADITQLLCDNCMPSTVHGLQALGFRDHRHGGINYLEDGSCCGGVNAFEKCPVSPGYVQEDNVVVSPNWPQWKLNV